MVRHRQAFCHQVWSSDQARGIYVCPSYLDRRDAASASQSATGELLANGSAGSVKQTTSTRARTWMEVRKGGKQQTNRPFAEAGSGGVRSPCSLSGSALRAERRGWSGPTGAGADMV